MRLEEGALARSAEPKSAATVLPTRFGPVVLDESRLIAFDDGLLGFAGRRRYLLADPPEGRRRWPFKLLQAADDPELTFPVLPLDSERGPIARADLVAACAGLGIAPADLAVLGVVSARRDEAGRVAFSVNLRAPLLVDTLRRRGRQHVLPDPRYDLRHPLPLRGSAADAATEGTGHDPA